MKFFVVLLALVVYTKATSEPITVQRRIKEAQQECVQEIKYDVAELKELFKSDYLPENNEKLNDYLFCLWEKVGVVEKDGELNVLQFKVIVPFLIKDKYPNVSDNDASELSSHAVDECVSSIGQAKCKGQVCVQFRNCVTKYVKEKQH